MAAALPALRAALPSVRPAPTAAPALRTAPGAGNHFAGANASSRPAAAAAVALALAFRRQLPAAARRQRPRRPLRTQRRATNFRTRDLLNVDKLGSSPFEKALAVNLDPTLYGSFAEIGAGQEVSRTFLTAGAAAGTVARSLSAYDMRLSDVTYGKASRYVTQERLAQMLATEYDTLEEYIRETRGPDTRFFAFASTLAAKAYMSNRECEGWVGVTYQDQVGAQRSSVILHVRMCDDTAQKQGEAIGVLGTNLVYLINNVSDPYIIASFLLDGLEAERLEIDFVDFSGPAFPEGSVDARLLAMRMVQFRVAVSVLLDYDEATGKHKQVVPNTSLYKRPVVVQRSRFRPVTHMHREVMQAAHRKLLAELDDDARPPVQILNLQIDDIVRPQGLVQTQGRLERARKMIEADQDGDGQMTLDELRALAGGRLSSQEIDQLLHEFDVEDSGYVAIDSLSGLSSESILATEFLDRFSMLAPLKLSVLVSGIRQTHKLSEYLARYTREQIALTIGGGKYSIERGLFNEEAYNSEQGGMLEAFGRLFSGNVRIFQYPNITFTGDITQVAFTEKTAEFLYNYLIAQENISPIATEYMSPEALNQDKNEYLRGQSKDVMELIQVGSADWERYVPPEVAECVKRRKWFKRLSSGQGLATVAFKVLNEL